MKTKIKILLLLTFVLTFFIGCGSKMPVEADLRNLHFQMVNQDSSNIEFPDYLKGKIAIIGLIYTNCPDVCPLITNNMQRIQRSLIKLGVKNVNFVSVSFDPERDKPSVLKEFALLREIKTDHWQFLTGKLSDIDTLRRHLRFLAIAGDTTKTSDGKINYSFVHTDRIYLMDKDLKVRKYYKGSDINIDDITGDVKKLM
jgi:protein SCO1/2